MQDTYGNYVNHGQHVTGGKVEIQESQTTAPPVNLSSRRPERPTLTSAGKRQVFVCRTIDHLMNFQKALAETHMDPTPITVNM